MGIIDEFHPFNELDVAEAERLALLLEEAGEVVQAIGKILRHGYESVHPDGGPTNRQALEQELGDMAAAVQMMCDRRDINGPFIKKCQAEKMRRVRKYLHHQSEAAQS